MYQGICKLCGQPYETFKHTVNDKIITQFLINAVVRLNYADPNDKVCNLCFAKARAVVGFVSLVNRAQSSFMNYSNIQNAGSSAKTAIADVHGAQKITKSFKNNPASHNEEKYSDPDVTNIQPKPARQQYSLEPQKNDFKCGKCKKKHGSYAEIEAHVIECFKESFVIKCTVCQKVFASRKSLNNHMEVHRAVKRQRKPATEKISTVSNDLTTEDTKRTDNNEGESQHSVTKIKCEEIDMNEILLENAIRII